MLNIFNRNRTKYADSGWSSENDTFWTKIAKRLNYFMNPDHQWTDYESWNENSTINKVGNFLKNTGNTIAGVLGGLDVNNQLESFINSQTGAHLTGSQVEANNLQMQNAHDIYQQQVSGMRAAGLNPALMYDSGASPSAPTVQGSQGSASMSDIMQSMLFDKQSKLLEAQVRNTDADTNKKDSETEYQRLVTKYFPGMKSVELDKMLADIGLTDEQIRKAKAEVDVLELDKELKRLDKIIRHAEADESSAYYKARRELEQATGEKERAEKEEILMRKAIELIEKQYMENTNTKMGTPQLISLAAGLGTLFHGATGDIPTSSDEGSVFNPSSASESFKRDMKRLAKWILETWSDGIGN